MMVNADGPEVFRVAFADAKDQEELEWIRELLPTDHFHVTAPESADRDELSDLLSDADFLITQDVVIDDELIAAANKLRLIQKYGSFRNGIDITAAREQGIQVATMPLLGVIAVAELVMTLILALSKQLVRADRSVKDGAYTGLDLEPERTSERKHAFQWMQMWDVTEIWGESLGIIGLGEIGIEVARRAHAFGMDVSYWKRSRLQPDEESELGVHWAGSLDELLAKARFVSLNVPLTSSTTHLIGAAELKRMREDAFLINSARGGVVDEEQLIASLEDGGIAGAGLDVFTFEPLPEDSPLTQLENVILTPHIGGGSGRGNRKRQMQDVLVNIRRAARGEAPHHLVK